MLMATQRKVSYILKFLHWRLSFQNPQFLIYSTHISCIVKQTGGEMQ